MAQDAGRKTFNPNYLSAIFLYVWALAFLVGALKIKDPGSRAFPIAICALCLVLATLIVLVERFGKGKEPLDFSGTNVALAMLALLLAYAAAIWLVGFYLATPFYMYVTMLMLGQKNRKIMVAVCLFFLLGVYLFFDVILKMQIPAGMLFS